MISLDFQFRGLTRIISLLKKSRNSWTKAVAHPHGDSTLLFITKKIRLVDFWGFNELLYLGRFCRRKKQKKKTQQSLESSLRLILPDVQRLPLNSRYSFGLSESDGKFVV